MCVCIHNYIHMRKEGESGWHVEDIMIREINQTQKDKPCVMHLLVGSETVQLMEAERRVVARAWGSEGGGVVLNSAKFQLCRMGLASLCTAWRLLVTTPYCVLGIRWVDECSHHGRKKRQKMVQRSWLGHRRGLLWYWMVYPGNEQRSFCRFWDCTQIIHFGLFCWLWGLLHFF